MTSANPQDFDGWTIVFDLDGTLVDTAPDLLGALNHVLVGAGLSPVTLDTVALLIGQGAKAMVERGLQVQGVRVSETEMDVFFERFLCYYAANIAVDSRPFPGATDALAALAARGARLAICTNKRQALSDQLLDELWLSGWFAAVLGADSVPHRKPDGDHILRTISAAGGDPARAIMVGDSRTDERAARNAGLPFVFVTLGYESEPVEALAADATIDSYAALVPALSDLRDQAEASLRGR